MTDRKLQYGTGSLSQRNGAWYGSWWWDGRKVKRRLGAVRTTTREGLTRKQAEARLREVIEQERAAISAGSRRTVAQVGAALVGELEVLGRKKATLEGYESVVRVHLSPYFGEHTMDQLTDRHVRGLRAAMIEKGSTPKTIHNAMGVLYSLFGFAQRNGWCVDNPCTRVRPPKVIHSDPDIRYLDHRELEALMAAIPDDALGAVEQAMYAVAAMAGLRLGELLALRWQDVDWDARRIRVRRALVRDVYGPPKSRRSSRSVPMAARVATELTDLHRRSVYDEPLDLVFAHPEHGGPLTRHRVYKRFKVALRVAGVRPVRFHDLRHTFGTRAAAAGVPLRTLQEWMGHRHLTTTEIYADYQPASHEAQLIDSAFATSGPPNPASPPHLRVLTAPTASGAQETRLRQMPDGATVSVAEAAARLGVRRETVYGRIRRGEIACYRGVGGIYRIPLTELGRLAAQAPRPPEPLAALTESA